MNINSPFQMYMKSLSDEKLRIAFEEYLHQKDTGSYQNASTIKKIRDEYNKAFSYKADYATVVKEILYEIALRWYEYA